MNITCDAQRFVRIRKLVEAPFAPYAGIRSGAVVLYCSSPETRREQFALLHLHISNWCADTSVSVTCLPVRSCSNHMTLFFSCFNT